MTGPTVRLKSEVFLSHAADILRIAPGSSGIVLLRRFMGLFGVTPEVCCVVWNQLLGKMPKGAQPHHLLWSLLFLKLYANEHCNRLLSGADEKTFRKWAWIFIGLIAELKVRPEVSSNISVDGTDFRVHEPTPFSGKWYSHKFHSAGLRYEVGIALHTGHIVWTNGPFPCGAWSDLRIFRYSMKHALQSGETVIADGTYKDPQCVLPQQSTTLSALHSIARARHETCNRRFKQFGALGQRFRHNLRKHGICFRSVVNLTQLMIENGYPLFALVFN
eukprot:IDg23605t1